MTSRTPADRLGHPDLGPLVDELVRRFASGHPPARITLPALGDRGNARLADLLGLDRYPAEGKQVAVDRLATAVGAGSADGLRSAVVALRGPLGDRRADREAAQAARTALWADVEAMACSLEIFGHPRAATDWMQRVADLGIPGGDVEAHRARIATAVACLRRLPATTPFTLAGLAADETGSAHGLDPGRRVTRMVLEALAIASGRPIPTNAESARALWEGVGVVPDPLSSSVLTIGLRPSGDDPLGHFLRATSLDAEPVVLTLRQLQRRPLTHRPEGGLVFVVENPSLIADIAGSWAGPPLLCSSGRPSMAVVAVVRQLIESGAVVLQHADFDAAGIDITRWLEARAGTVPWRMGADDYSAAVATRPTTALEGKVGPTPWAPDLGPSMVASGRAVHEEAIRADLLSAIRDQG